MLKQIFLFNCRGKGRRGDKEKGKKKLNGNQARKKVGGGSGIKKLRRIFYFIHKKKKDVLEIRWRNRSINKYFQLLPKSPTAWDAERSKATWRAKAELISVIVFVKLYEGQKNSKPKNSLKFKIWNFFLIKKKQKKKNFLQICAHKNELNAANAELINANDDICDIKSDFAVHLNFFVTKIKRFFCHVTVVQFNFSTATAQKLGAFHQNFHAINIQQTGDKC